MIEVEVPDVGLFEFPDEMSQDEIAGHLDNFIKGTPAPPTTQSTQAPTVIQPTKPVLSDEERARKKEELQTQMAVARKEGLSGRVAENVIDMARAGLRMLTPLDITGNATWMQHYAGEPPSPPLIPPQFATETLEPVTRAAQESLGNLGITIPEDIRKGTTEAGGEFVSGMTTPEMVGQMAFGVRYPEAFGRLIQGQMIRQVPEATRQLIETAPQGEGSDVTKAGLNLAGAVGFPIAIGQHYAGRRTIPEKGEPNALQKQSTDEIPVQPAPGDSKTVGEKVRSAEKPAGEGETGTPVDQGTGGKTEAEVPVTPPAERTAVLPKEKPFEPGLEPMKIGEPEKPKEGGEPEAKPSLPSQETAPVEPAPVGGIGEVEQRPSGSDQPAGQPPAISTTKPEEGKTQVPPKEGEDVGPGMGGARAGEKNPAAQIEQLADAFKNVSGNKVPFGQRVREAFRIGERIAQTKDAIGRAVSGLKTTFDLLVKRWEGIDNIDDLMRAKGELSAEMQKRGVRVREWIRQAKKAIPSKRDQAAIAKWVDAGGDKDLLMRGYNEAPPEYKQAYMDAMNLKGDLLTAAQNIRNYFEARLQEAIDAGVLDDGIENYIHRLYEHRPKVAKQVRDRARGGLLQTRPGLTKKRTFDFDWEAEKLGYRPVQSFIDRIAVYETELSRAIAAREFIRRSMDMTAKDGRPVIDVKGVGVPIEDPSGVREGTLIKPKSNPAKSWEEGSPNYRGDYVTMDLPALRKWKWVALDSNGKPIFVQGDVAVHPDFARRFAAMLEPSRIRFGKYGGVMRPALALSSTVKQTMLDLSGFHMVQVTLHGAEHKVAPWKILRKIDLNDPDVNGLLKGGVTLGGDAHPMTSEGLFGASLTRHIPGLGPLAEAYHNWLFQDYIPKLKMTMALKALERNRQRYGGKLSEEQIYFKTAQQANGAFGGLNYLMLERSKTAQDLSRLILLAPDFLEARGRFALEAFAKGGKTKVPGFGNEQRAALLLGAITMWVTARILNKLADDQYHFEPENAFSVVLGQHAYSMRTVQGDILHLIKQPVQFWMHRLNPTYTRPLFQLGTGRDYYGRQRTPLQTGADTVANMVPIALRNNSERKLWESMLNSLGVNVRRYNVTDDAFKLAQKWKEANGIAERGEFIYDPQKDVLRPLKLAISSGDDAQAAVEIRKVLESGVYTKPKLDAYFKRYATMPFTGSKSNDKQWYETLSDDEKMTVDNARDYKRQMLNLYRSAMGIYQTLE